MCQEKAARRSGKTDTTAASGIGYLLRTSKTYGFEW